MNSSLRIVSLVPSLSLTVADLGLATSLVGCTNFCVKPPNLHRTVRLIGGTKDPDLEQIAALRPTHIIVNEEENQASDIAACQQIAPTYSCKPITILDSIAVISELGKFLKVENRAEELTFEATILLEKIRSLAPQPNSSALYLVWRNPWMAARENTYVSHAMALLGFRNQLEVAIDRYPHIELSNFSDSKPKLDVVLFSSEPYPFRRRDVDAFASEWKQQTPAPLPNLLWINGQLCSWWGSHTIDLLRQALKFYEIGHNDQLFKSFATVPKAT